MTSETERWNHNIHYHRLILDAVPSGARRALDVGCGEGQLSRRLCDRVTHVTAIDLDPASIDLARSQDGGAGVDYVVGDFLLHPLEASSFDAVVSVAALHHMDAATALTRMRELLRPEGTLVVVGLARPRLPVDLPVVAAGAIATRWHGITKTCWESPSPTLWPPPPETFAETRVLAARVIPGARYRRHLLWRYSLVWTKPRS